MQCLTRRRSSLDVLNFSLVDKFGWRSKLDESIDLLHDVVITRQYSPSQIEAYLEKIFLYSTVGNCIEYGKARTMEILKNTEDCSFAMEKYNFV